MSYPPNIFKKGVPLLTRDEDESPNAVYIDPPTEYLSQDEIPKSTYSHRAPTSRSYQSRTPIRR